MSSDPYENLPDDARQYLSIYLTSRGPDNKGNWRGFCAIHEDPNSSGTPSAGYNFDKGKWNCLSCDAGGSIEVLIKNVKKNERELGKPGTNVVSLKTGKAPEPLPGQMEIDEWVQALLENPGKLEYLKNRCIDIKAIENFEIGWNEDDKRLYIPVRDSSGVLTNIRRYSPNHKLKILPWSDGYPVSLFNASALKGRDAIVLCEGEWDCIVLNSMGIPAVTHTAGVKGFRPEWSQFFKGKAVWLMFDMDEKGAEGVAKVAGLLEDVASAVYSVQLKFNEDDEGDKNDVTDFFKAGHTAAELEALMEQATQEPLWVTGGEPEPVPTTGTLVTLEGSQEASGEIMEMYVKVFAKQTPAYIAPKRFELACAQDKGNKCRTCPLAKYSGQFEQEIREDDEIILSFLETTSDQRSDLMLKKVGTKCKDVRVKQKESWNVEQLHVSQSIEHLGDETGAPYSDMLYNVGNHATPSNTTARVVGKRIPDPKTGRGAFYSWIFEPVEEDIDSYSLTDDELDDLAIFQPAERQTPLEKCQEIAEDLSANITQIYGRNQLHIAYDLGFHSVLGFSFAGKPVQKGWLDMLVIGDTRTGKSEAAGRLRDHYKSGVMTSCEGATLAGLLGGAQQFGGKHWVVTWGVVPRNDRRLVILDELSGMKDKGVVEEMSSVRSEGVARITKIANEETSARTRLIWISNPADGKSLTEANGMSALTRLIENPEDIARFDYVLAARNTDVESSLINSLDRTKVPHRYTSELCSRLILWAWSRRVDQVRFSRSATEAVITAAEDFGNRYVPDPPLVQVENIRMKLARIAVAIAARTFSTNETGELIVVTTTHVESAVKFLDSLYATDAMGYQWHSRQVTERRKKAHSKKGEVKNMLKKSPRLLTVLEAVQQTNKFKMRDFDDFGGAGGVTEFGTGSDIAHWLLERQMLRWIPGGYIAMEPSLVAILRELEIETE